MKLKVFVQIIASAVLVAFVVDTGLVTVRRLHKSDEVIPTLRLWRGDMDLTVFADGEVRPARTIMLTAPAVGGGALRIVRLERTGSHVRGGDVVMEFDPAEQQFNIEQNRSAFLQAEQEILKAKADVAVQAADDQVALLKARFNVRRAELEVGKNELVSAIDARKNQMALDEARRRLAQLEKDTQSHQVFSNASLAVYEEKRNKARLGMQEAQRNIEALRVIAPISGLVEVKDNREAAGGVLFAGMTLPEFHEGDQVQPGTFIAQILDSERMEIQAAVSEDERANLNPGQRVEVHLDALPEEILPGTLKSVSGIAGSGSWWAGNTSRKFDVICTLDRPDQRLRPGFTAQLRISSGHVKNALLLPRQSLYERDGEPVVYVTNHGGFEAHRVKIVSHNESVVEIDGLQEGAEVALTNPEERQQKPAQSARPMDPSTGGGEQ